VARIRTHPLVPNTIPIYGYVCDVTNGKLVEVPEATQAGEAGTQAVRSVRAWPGTLIEECHKRRTRPDRLRLGMRAARNFDDPVDTIVPHESLRAELRLYDVGHSWDGRIRGDGRWPFTPRSRSRYPPCKGGEETYAKTRN
jgi:hypothetical protein